MRTMLQATRWRLRFLVGIAQWLRLTVKECQILRPCRTVAATGKRSARFGGSTLATALFGWARSVASFNRQGLPNTQAWPDSRRYREKIRTILEAARWRLRFLVGLAHSLRATFPDGQILRPCRTVAATGKRSTRFWSPHDYRYLKESQCAMATDVQ